MVSSDTILTTAACCNDVTQINPFDTTTDGTMTAGTIKFERMGTNPTDTTRTDRCGKMFDFTKNQVHYHPYLIERFVETATTGQFSQSEFNTFDFRKFPWGNYCAIKFDSSFYDEFSVRIPLDDFGFTYDLDHHQMSCNVKESCLHAADMLTQHLITDPGEIYGKNCWAVGHDGTEVSVNTFNKQHANQWLMKPAINTAWCPTGEPSSNDCMFADYDYAVSAGFTNYPLQRTYININAAYSLGINGFPDLNLFTGLPDANGDGLSDANPDNTACLTEHPELQGAPLFCEMSVKDFNTEDGIGAVFSHPAPLSNDKYVALVGMLSSSTGCLESGAMNMYVQTHLANEWIYEISQTKAGRF